MGRLFIAYLIRMRLFDHLPDIAPKFADIIDIYGTPTYFEQECGVDENKALCARYTRATKGYPAILLWKDPSAAEPGTSVVPKRFDFTKERAMADDKGRPGGFNIGRLLKWVQRVAKLGGRIESACALRALRGGPRRGRRSRRVAR